MKVKRKEKLEMDVQEVGDKEDIIVMGSHRQYIFEVE